MSMFPSNTDYCIMEKPIPTMDQFKILVESLMNLIKRGFKILLPEDELFWGNLSLQGKFFEYLVENMRIEECIYLVNKCFLKSAKFFSKCTWSPSPCSKSNWTN